MVTPSQNEALVKLADTLNETGLAHGLNEHHAYWRLADDILGLFEKSRTGQEPTRRFAAKTMSAAELFRVGDPEKIRDCDDVYGLAGLIVGHAHGITTAADRWADYQWLCCPDEKARRIKPGLSLVTTVRKDRRAKLRCYGNAVVPRIPEAIARAHCRAIRRYQSCGEKKVPWRSIWRGAETEKEPAEIAIQEGLFEGMKAEVTA